MNTAALASCSASWAESSAAYASASVVLMELTADAAAGLFPCSSGARVGASVSALLAEAVSTILFMRNGIRHWVYCFSASFLRSLTDLSAVSA